MQLLKVLAAVAAGAIVIVCAVVLLAPAGAFAATGAIAQVPQVGQAAPPEPERCVTPGMVQRHAAAVLAQAGAPPGGRLRPAAAGRPPGAAVLGRRRAGGPRLRLRGRLPCRRVLRPRAALRR